MKSVDFLILGGGIAGTTAAEAIREKNAYSTIAILEEEPHVLYSRVMIPKYLKGLAARDALFLRKINDYVKKNINFYPSTRISKIDLSKREASAEGGEIFHYGKLLIASGGKPKPLPDVFRYAGGAKILRMQTLADADLIKKTIGEAPGRAALVAGESFIALEFISVFAASGFKIHLAAKGDVWGEAHFGRSAGEILEENFKKYGVVLHKKTEVSFFKNGAFLLKNGDAVRADLVGVGIGLARDFSPLGGLETASGVLADEYLNASDPDVYAAGDIAEFFDVVANRRRLVGNWTSAFLQGRAAGLNMLASFGGDGAGEKSAFKNVPSYNITNLETKITSLGDLAGAEDEFEKRGGETLLRAVFKGGKISGAVLINRFNDKIRLSQMIEQGAAKDEVSKIFS